MQKERNVVINSWMQIAFTKLGVREIPGEESNPEIDEFLAIAGLHSGDETPWCSVAVCYPFEKVGIRSTRKANARSWLGWGQHLEVPLFGCVVVLWRISPDSEFGHVGFYIGYDNQDRIYVLGGNQGNMFTISPFPMERVLDYRFPVLIHKM